MIQNFKRWQESILLNSLNQRRVLLLTGARQCGKTTLAKMLASNNTIYRTLDDLTLLNAAQSDPKSFVSHGSELMIIDEIQRAPKLLQTIKQNVDENQQAGRFLLTGSANIQALPTVSESLAGRVKKIRLRPLSIGEVKNSAPTFLKRAFRKDLQTNNTEQKHTSDTNKQVHQVETKDSYLKYAFLGGYPEARLMPEIKDRRSWHQDYLDALLSKDLLDITNIRRKDSMFNLVKVLAAWSSKYMDISGICQKLSVTRPTVESYINALEALYIVDKVKPWYKTDYDRVGKQDKLFFSDTGMMTAILNWRFEKVRLDGSLNGKLVETFVYNQLAADLEAQAERYEIFHYRDREKREIDFIIESEEEEVLGIEVKAGSDVDKSMFKHLIWFKKNIMARDKTFIGVVLYTGEHTLSFGDNLWAIPIANLWQ
jgi:predicted AAA+ superfamily ATPase